MQDDYLKGRGSQVNPPNKFNPNSLVKEHLEGIDEFEPVKPSTQIFIDHPKTIINEVTSPDIGIGFSVNPYQGCEHGCAYCYARNAHEYWGFSAGIDFESKIVIKPNAPLLLESAFRQKSWQPSPISLSGNTDCYQPLEREHQLTRGLLKVFLSYRNPVGIITKNSLILRDTDLLSDLAKRHLLHVYISVTTLNEDLRSKMEPRTASAKRRLQVIESLSKLGIPVGVMVAPIIPGLNNHEIPDILKAASDNGALTAGYTVVRLNGQIETIFKDWLYKNVPFAANKVWHQIESLHGGSVKDSTFGRRIKGDGVIAKLIEDVFLRFRDLYFHGRAMPAYDVSQFNKLGEKQPTLFDP